jgi:hypothetical protein
MLVRLLFCADSELMHADATAMPDAVEIIFQSALEYGRHGGVSEALSAPCQNQQKLVFYLLLSFSLLSIYLICFISGLKF